MSIDGVFAILAVSIFVAGVLTEMVDVVITRKKTQ